MLEKTIKNYYAFMNAETKKHSALRFVLLLIILIGYIIYAIHKYGTSNGLLVTALSWSFFIFCTPIADAGFLVAFPTRILLKVRMIYTQIIAYFVATLFVAFAFMRDKSIFSKTILLKLFYAIMITPQYMQ
jgi:hypothetical protein